MIGVTWSELCKAVMWYSRLHLKVPQISAHPIFTKYSFRNPTEKLSRTQASLSGAIATL
jgi:hypothetical protein